MKTLLVLAQHPELVEAVQAGLNPAQYRVLHRTGLEEAEPLLSHGLADGCIMDVELSSVQAVWFLEKLRRLAPKIPLIIYTGARQWEWEEEAYLHGAAHVLAKPVRARLLSALLERVWPTPPVATAPVPPPTCQAVRSPIAMETGSIGAGRPEAAQSLGVLRDFSGILTHSLNAEGMLKQFLLLLREILGINRAAIFLRQPVASFGESPTPQEARRLRAACAIGLSAGLLQHFELSSEAGIGGHLFRSGRILRRNGEEARDDVESQKEFELLGGQVAVPILDREAVLGAAIFDGRVTGEPLVNSELELVFHLLEQVGLGLKNIWLHDQLTGNHEMMAGILRELSIGCVVVSRDLAVLHANKMARKYFAGAERRSGELEFSDLPQILGTKVYQVLKTGSALTNFKYEPENSPGTVYNVSVVPFQKPQVGLPASALLMAEDLTQSRQLQRLEIEAANLRLVKTMADRLTHEMGNAMTGLVAHQQYLDQKLKSKAAVDVDDLKRMNREWEAGNRRAQRLIEQMRYLNVDSLVSPEAFPVAPLIQEAFQEARKHQPARAPHLDYDPEATPVLLTGDRKALRYALAEVILNALQANPNDPKIGVRLEAQAGANGQEALRIEVQDNGPGFTAEAAEKAAEPFFTTRGVGVGLGLTVTQKIVQTHRGKLEIVAPKPGQAGLVRISLPLGRQE